jgi:hypothetical protein
MESSHYLIVILLFISLPTKVIFNIHGQDERLFALLSGASYHIKRMPDDANPRYFVDFKKVSDSRWD